MLDNDEFLTLECKFCEKLFKIRDKVTLLDCDHLIHSICLEQQVVVNESLLCLDCDYGIIQIKT